MKIFALEYSGYKFDHTFNLGDDVQTLATCHALGQVDGYVSREHLDTVREPCIVSLNGFFMGSNNWPPADTVIPILYSFHISPKYEQVICSPAGIAYLKRFQPVGCRDQGTVSILRKHGVDAFYSKCLTLTFSRRTETPAAGKVFIVGVSPRVIESIPRKLEQEAIYVNQAKLQLPEVPTPMKMALAQHLLDIYRHQARLVITSKIHCAMPCIAMGIPVVFIYDAAKRADYRVSIMKDLTGIHHLGETWFARKFINPGVARAIDWNPPSLDIEDEKARILKGFYEAFARAKESYRMEFGT